MLSSSYAIFPNADFVWGFWDDEEGTWIQHENDDTDEEGDE